MATTGQSFSIALAIYSACCVAILLAFSWWRRAPWLARFYAPKSFLKGPQPKPKHIRARNPLAWITTTVEAPDESVILFAGVDALMYLKILRFGMQLFLGVSLLSLAIVLPINCTGCQVDRLMAAQVAPAPASQFTYWLPMPTPSPQDQTGEVLSVKDTQPTVTEPPNFYEKSIPPAPVGLEWWEYKPDLPLLPQPVEVYGPNYSRFGWRYNAQYQDVQYRFSDLDKTTMANIEAGSPRLYAHALLAWVVSLFALRLLHRFNQEAIGLRIYSLLNSPAGAESHTVLLTDIPGISYGTVLHRTDNTLLRFLPRCIKSWLAGAAVQGVKMVGSQLKLGASRGAVAAAKGKADRGADVPGASSRQAEPAHGDFSIAAGRPDGRPQLRVGLQEPEGSWQQVLHQLKNGSTIQQVVDDQMRALFGEEFDHAFLVRDTSTLDPLVAEYNAMMRAATDLMDQYLGLKRRRRDIKPLKVTVVGVSYGSWGMRHYGAKPVRVDALQHYRDRLVELRGLIAEEQEVAQQKVVPAAFVTFKTRKAQVIASTSLLHQDTAAWRCHPAPAPDEVVWGNVGWRLWERSSRLLLMWAAFVVLALFYMVPITAVQSLLALNSVTTWFASMPMLNALVTAILPSLVLKLFLKLLLAILGLMNRISGMVSEADVDLGVVSRFFAFQVLTVFVGSFIAGSFANQLMQFLKNPGSIVTVLGTAAPQTAIFFTTYLMLQALLAKPLSLLRLFGLLMFFLRSKFAATERAKARVWQDQKQKYGDLIPDDTIAILLGLVFCLICPIIAPFALIYCAVVFVVWKYQLLYVKHAAYQSGGQAWTRVFDQVCTALLLFQSVMCGILSIKQVVVPPLIVLPLLPLTAFFWWACHALFWRPQQTLALDDAVRLDGEDSQAGAGWDSWRMPAGSAELYLSPAFKLSGAEFEAFLYETDAMLHFLATGEQSDELEAIQAQATATMEAAYETAGEELGIVAATSSTHLPSGPVGSSGTRVVMMHNQVASWASSTADEAASGAHSIDLELGVRRWAAAQ